MWQEMRIGWDKGKSSPALIKLLETDIIPTTGNVLVPGCGSGYDVFLFASRGPSVRAFGLDISTNACAHANKVCNVHV